MSVNLLFTRDKSNNITIKLCDKRDAFDFHIVNFPFMSSSIPPAPTYSVYASQLIRYACCSNYSDFLLSYSAIVTRLLSQGYKINRLSNTFTKFYGRHTYLVDNTRRMSAKCLLILSVKLIFIFDGFADGWIVVFWSFNHLSPVGLFCECCRMSLF